MRTIARVVKINFFISLKSNQRLSRVQKSLFKKNIECQQSGSKVQNTRAKLLEQFYLDFWTKTFQFHS